MTTIRGLGNGDIAGAEFCFDRAIRPVIEQFHGGAPERTESLIESGRRRIAYLHTTDPRGSFVADEGAEIVGFAQSHVRGPIWVLANLGVVPEHQDKGLGKGLLERALEYSRDCPLGAIVSSEDPRAMHRYVSAGFALHPTAAAHGPVRVRPVTAATTRPGDRTDLDLVARVSAAVRGVDRSADVAFMVELGYALVVDDGGGFTVVRDGRIGMLCALDDETASRLVRSFLASTPPEQAVDVRWITAAQQWAVRTLTAAGIPMRIDGSIMMRGAWEPGLPYLPNGIFG